MLEPSISVGAHVAAPPVGSVEANALFAPSMPTHRATEGQATWYTPELAAPMSTTVQSAVAPVGLVDVTILPPKLSPATHSVSEAHVTYSAGPGSTDLSVQVGAAA